jgi:polysaccharide export outer membrane protein
MLRALDRIRQCFRRSPLTSTLVVGALVATLSLTSGAAQDMPAGVSRDLLQRALQQHDGDNTDDSDVPPRETKPQTQTIHPVAPTSDLPKSRLETLYEQRAGRPLSQFGYKYLGAPSDITISPAGALQDSYVIAQGDEVVVTLRGQENATYRQRIGRDGRLTLPKLPPILAGGRKLGDFRSDLEAQIHQAYVSTNVFISLGDVHQVSVLVSGEVATPGPRILSALASPLDAILLSGGISKTGSLRNIRILRNGTTRTLDLYSVINRGNAADLGMLQNGDRIYVPPLGATVAIAGFVRRPGIYELAGAATQTGADALIKLAGGIEIAGAYTLTKSSLDRDGSIRLLPFSKSGPVKSGEILFVDPTLTSTLDSVTLLGAVSSVGARALANTHSVSQLIHSASELMVDAYTPYAVIIRRNPISNSTTLIPFSLTQVLAHRADVPLQGNDGVYIFNIAEARALSSFVTKNINLATQSAGNHANDGFNYESANAETPSWMIASTPGGDSASSGGTRGTGAARNAGADNGGTDGADSSGGSGAPANTPGGSGSSTGGFNSDRVPSTRSGTTTVAAQSAAALVARSEGYAVSNQALLVTPQNDLSIINEAALTMGITPRALARAASDNLIWVLDSVLVPGPYVVGPGTTLAEMIAAAGGPLRKADLSAIEVTSTNIDQLAGTSRTVRSSYTSNSLELANVNAKSLDVIRLRPVFSDREEGTVTVVGQVRYPGVFDITRDERLSSVLQRAGGITEVGYPYGAIFTRAQAALAEKEGNERTARQIEQQGLSAASVTSTTTATTDPSKALDFLVGMARELRNAPALGRVMVTADPTVLATRPDLDVVLQPGDSLFIPKRPSSVSVSGEVLNPGAFQFQASLTLDSYIRLAGGSSQFADVSRAFVVLPDGSAMPRDTNWLSFGGGGGIPPGSVIVVPRDLRPFDWLQFFKDVTQIASQLAVSAASLSVLSNNNN